jgi:hypothetical protein
MLWQQCRENSEDIKQPVVYIDVTKKIYEKYINLKLLNLLLITFQHFVKLPISFYNRILKDSFFFINVQLRGIYRFLCNIVLLTET